MTTGFINRIGTRSGEESMKKIIGILSHRRAMAEFYGEIFQELFKDFAEIFVAAAEDDSICGMPKADLYISSVTSYDLRGDSELREFINGELKPIRMDVTFSKAAVDLLQTYPEGTKALLVNQNKHMAMECIAQLYHLGISNIEFYPCYPGIERLPTADMTFTVGEPDLVPESVIRAVNIGSRLPSANVICEAALRLGNAFFLEGKRFKRYRNRLANVDYSLETISSKNLSTENRLEIILNTLEEGIVCVNEKDEVTLINKTARQMLDVSRSEALGRPVSEAVPELFSAFGEEKRFNQPTLLNIRGTDLGANLIPLKLEEKSVGSFMTLQSFQEKERQQSSLRRQKNMGGHKAASQFEDIVGRSAKICQARDLAKRIALNDAAILICGESGTGRNMFAQAIHNGSSRSEEAFVTVNCVALKDEEIEMELFGSVSRDEAENTGDRIGLIEMAHRGTLYLENIEHMSHRMQACLLNILERREITRHGAIESIPVDVRIISSTSENMLGKVREGNFLRDLYYRLNAITLNLPTLRERRSDIPDLIAFFHRKAEADFELTARAKQALIQHSWEGNVRELKNAVEYLSYIGQHTIDLEDLPQVVKASQIRSTQREDLKHRSGLNLQEYLVLKELGENYRNNKGMGRQAIVANCLSHGTVISEHETRNALWKLSELGYAAIRTGRGGSRLTEEGYLLYRQLLYGEEEEANFK